MSMIELMELRDEVVSSQWLSMDTKLQLLANLNQLIREA